MFYVWVRIVISIWLLESKKFKELNIEIHSITIQSSIKKGKEVPYVLSYELSEKLSIYIYKGTLKF